MWLVFTSWQKQMIDRSQFVAELMDKKVDDGAYVDGMLIGLDVLPDQKSLSFRTRMMPLETSALVALDRAWRKWSSHWAERTSCGTIGVNAVAFSPDGKRVLTGASHKTARLWDAATGAAVATLEGHIGPITAVAFSPDGKLVLTQHWMDAGAWERRNQRCVSDAPDAPVMKCRRLLSDAVAFSPDGKRVLTGSFDRTARLWDAATGAAVATFEGHRGPINAIALSPDGKRALTGSTDKTARLWDVATGTSVATLEGHTGPVTAVAFSPDDKRVLTGSWDNTARLWDAATGTSVATLGGNTEGMTTVTFSPDSKLVLTGAFDETARLWDAATGTAIATGTHGPVTAAAFSPDGKRILTASSDKTARLWDAATGGAAATLEGGTDADNTAAFSPDGRRVLIGSDDKTARLWHVFSSAQDVVDEVKSSLPRCVI